MSAPAPLPMLPGMWPYHPDLLARPVPRYTSYPTAVEFSERIGAEAQEQALTRVTSPESLYVHIPYCTEICWYCGCNTGAANRQQRLTAYLDALHEEIAITSALLPDHTEISRIAFGGGSPNALSPVTWIRLLDRLVTSFRARSPSISIELDPRALDDAWKSIIGGTHITHASLGVQSFDPRVQAAIGRVQPLDSIEQAVACLRGSGVRSLNFDLMYGLPHQDAAVLEDTLATTIALAPDRVAFFGYAHVPEIIARQRRIDASALPDTDSRFALAAAGHAQLTGAGYQPVGFDHYAKPADPLARAARAGTLRRNFQGFTDDEAECVIGLGASAISIYPDRIIQNEKNAGRYRMRLSQGRLPAALGTLRSEEDRRRALLIEDFLCGREADLNLIEGGPEIAGDFAPFLDRGLAEQRAAGIGFTDAGRPYARVMAALIDAYRHNPVRRSSSAV